MSWRWTSLKTWWQLTNWWGAGKMKTKKSILRWPDGLSAWHKGDKSIDLTHDSADLCEMANHDHLRLSGRHMMMIVTTVISVINHNSFRWTTATACLRWSATTFMHEVFIFLCIPTTFMHTKARSYNMIQTDWADAQLISLTMKAGADKSPR